jgi:hypothetical protein
MKPDALIQLEGMEILAEKLGPVDAERFVALLNKERFDYTEWQKVYFKDFTVDEFLTKARQYSDKSNK